DALVQLKRSNELKPEMPETLYSLGKAAATAGEGTVAEQAWLKVIELEKNTSLAAQAYFGLAGLHRKQGKLAQSQQEMQEFQKLQSTIGPPRSEELDDTIVFKDKPFAPISKQKNEAVPLRDDRRQN